MKLRIGWIITVMLAGCGSAEKLTGVDGRTWLSALDGPKVEGVNATLLRSAREAEASGDYATAVNYYRQLTDKDPENKEYLTGLADVLRKAGQVDQALDYYEAVLKKQKDFPPALEGKALALMQRGDMDDAQLLFTELAKSGKASWRTHNGLGIILAAGQSPAQAKAHFDEAKRLSPDNPSVLNNIGLAQAMESDYDAAIATFAQAAALSASRPAVRKQIELNAAMVHAAAGRLDRAEAIAKQHLQGAALNNNMGLYAHLAKDNDLARTYFNMALSQSKRFYPRAWNNLEALKSGTKQTAATPRTLKLPDAAPVAAASEEKAQAAVPVTPVQLQPAAPPAAQAQPVVLAPAAAPKPQPAAVEASVPTPPVPEAPAALGQIAPAAGATVTTLSAAPDAAGKPAATNKQEGRDKNDIDNGFEALTGWIGSLVD